MGSWSGPAPQEAAPVRRFASLGIPSGGHVEICLERGSRPFPILPAQGAVAEDPGPVVALDPFARADEENSGT